MILLGYLQLVLKYLEHLWAWGCFSVLSLMWPYLDILLKPDCHHAWVYNSNTSCCILSAYKCFICWFRFRSIDVNNGGISVFTFNKKGEAMLQSLNMTAHMYNDHTYVYWNFKTSLFGEEENSAERKHTPETGIQCSWNDNGQSKWCNLWIIPTSSLFSYHEELRIVV